MGKLVRDKIPDLIRGSGREVETRVLNREEYLNSLFGKLAEDGEELKVASAEDRLEEMADVFEVLRTLAEAAGYSIKDVEQAADNKLLERGGFSQRIWLEQW